MGGEFTCPKMGSDWFGSKEVRLREMSVGQNVSPMGQKVLVGSIYRSGNPFWVPIFLTHSQIDWAHAFNECKRVIECF